MGDIYLGAKDIALFGYEIDEKHLYLIYDPNLDGDSNILTGTGVEIIRGGPQYDANDPEYLIFNFGPIVTEAGVIIADSEDGFTNGNGTIDSLQDRNVTKLDLGGQNADTLWLTMQVHALQINNSQFDYDLANTFQSNSNSVVSSILSGAGIDVSTQLPKIAGDEPLGDPENSRFTFNTFPGASTFLSGSGSDTLQGFNGDDRFYDVGGGNDEFYGGTVNNAVVRDTNDGYDTVVYEKGGFAGLGLVVRQKADHREVDDKEGGIDKLYSIEQVNMRTFFLGNTIDYSEHGRGINMRDTGPVELENMQAADPDLVSYMIINEGGPTTTFNLFGAGNFGTYIGSTFRDSFYLNTVIGRHFDGGNDTGDFLSYASFADPRGLKMDIGLGTVLIQGTDEVAGPGAPITDTFVNMESYQGSRSADEIYGSERGESLHGGAGNDFILGGAGNDGIAGGSGYDTVNYNQDRSSEQAAAVYVRTGGSSLPGASSYGLSVTDRFGATDQIIEVESLILTSLDDRVDFFSTGSLAGLRLLDGGDGYDVFAWNDRIPSYIQESGDTWIFSDNNGQQLTINNFESVVFSNQSINTTITTILPDFAGNNGAPVNLVTSLTGESITVGRVDMSASTRGGDFTFGAGSNNNIADFGTSTYVLRSPTWVKLPNYTNEIVVEAGSSMSASFATLITGTGDDAVQVTSGGIPTIHYTGGNDSYFINSTNNRVYLSHHSSSDVASAFAKLENGTTHIELGFSGGGSLDLFVPVLMPGASYYISTRYGGSIRFTAEDDPVNPGQIIIQDFANDGGEPSSPWQTSYTWRNDRIQGGEFSDALYGLGGDDVIYGGSGNDGLHGGSGNDTLYGGSGNDFLSGGEGTDTLIGGAGDDVYIFDSDGSYDRIVDAEGFNVVRIDDASISYADLSFERVGDDLRINIASGLVIEGFYSGSPTLSNIVLTGSSQSFDLTELLDLEPGNTFPEAADDVFNVLEGQTVLGNVLIDNGNGADSDADGDPLSVVPAEIITTGGGSVLLLGDGNFIYTPLGTFHGLDSFTYELQDGRGGSDIGTVFLNITPVNDAPEARDDYVTGFEDSAITGNVLTDNRFGADRDADGDVLSVVPATITTINGGTVTLLANGDFTYTPIPEFFGQDGFEYTLIDGQGEQDTAQVYLDVQSVNDAPTPQDDDFVTEVGQALNGNVLNDNGHGIDTDPEGNAVSVVPDSFTTAAGGSVVINPNGNFTYTPPAGFAGTDGFIYILSDEFDAQSTSTVSILVNNPPEAKDDVFTGAQDIEIEGNLLVDNGNGADFDLDGDNLRVVQTVVESAAGGSVILMANGDFAYMPPAGYSGNDSFEYTVTDGKGGEATATAFINLTPVINENDDPVAQNDTGDGYLLQNITGNVLTNDSDPNGHNMQVQAAGLMTANGGLVMLLSNGDYTYTPVAGFTGSDSFSYTVLDGHGGSATATVNLTVALTGQEKLGNAGNNTITGTKYADTILGLDGNDQLKGNKGHDKLLGGKGNDKLYGEDGNDLLIGSKGDDRLEGGNGNDTLIGDDAIRLTKDFNKANLLFPDLKERVDIDNLAPPGTPALGMVDGDLTSTTAQTATITFVESGAGYNNTLGVYNIAADGTILNVDIAFESVKKFKAGEQATLDLPGEPNSNFGFFIIADGYNVNNAFNKTDFDNGSLSFIYHYGQADERLAKVTDNGAEISLVFDNGVKETLIKGPVYHTTERGDAPTLNTDGKVHVVSGFTDSHDDTALRIGFEDLPHTGDADYNDVVFDIVYSPVYLNAGTEGGNDTLYGGAGNDLLIGGMGNDTLYGGTGADTFKYLKGDNGTDTIKDFSMAEGDVIDIQDVLAEAYDPVADMISQFVKLTNEGNKATLSVDADGAANGSNFTAVAVIDGCQNLTLDSLVQNQSLLI